MSIFQIVSIMACLGSILIKWFFSHRISATNKLLNLEYKAYLVAKKELKLAMNVHRKTEGEHKKLESQHLSIRRNLSQINILHQKMAQEQATLRQQKLETLNIDVKK